MLIARLISVLIGYCFGLLLFGQMYSRSKNVDITTKGSGNVGTTNILRNFGWKGAAITFFGDAFKLIFAVLLVWVIFRDRYPEGVRLLELYAGFGAILGHNHPFYMKHFKGGKGIACTAGLLLAFCAIEIPACLIIFVATVALTRYVSLGSILVCIAFFVQTVLFGQLGWLNVTTTYRAEIYILAAVISLMGIVRHRENIGRLLHGNENKLSLKGKQKYGKNRNDRRRQLGYGPGQGAE